MSEYAESAFNNLINTDPPEYVCHYTSDTGFTGIITDRKFHASHILYLNDSSEYQLTIEICRDKLEEIKEDNTKTGLQRVWASIIRDSFLQFLEIIDPEIYVACFSKYDDDLSQWRAYTGESSGYAICFNSDYLRNIAVALNGYLAPCVYDFDEQQTLIDEIIESELNRQDIYGILKDTAHQAGSQFGYLQYMSDFLTNVIQLAPLIKNSKFSDEREWRLVAVLTTKLRPPSGDVSIRQGKSMLIPYYKIDLGDPPCGISHIRVGPTPHVKLAKDAVVKFIRYEGYGNAMATNKNNVVQLQIKNMDVIRVYHSEIPFRNW